MIDLLANLSRVRIARSSPALVLSITSVGYNSVGNRSRFGNTAFVKNEILDNF